MKRVLVTGGAGFIGCNLVDRLALQGRQVVVLDNLSRPGVDRNMDWLLSRHGDSVVPVIGDVRDRAAVETAAQDVGAVFHLAAQVAVTTSLSDPSEDCAVNLLGALNVLETLRRAPGQASLIFASTNKVYGDLGDIALDVAEDRYVPADPQVRRRGVDERRPLAFHTPYGCSKGAADQYVLDYCRSFGVPTCVLRMSCIYGPRQMGTEDQGWVAHFLRRALQGQPIDIYGDGRQVRDLLYVSDAVDAYLSAWRSIGSVKGRAFNLGGGPANAVSLRQVLAEIEQLVSRPVELRYADWRPGDQRYYVSDTAAARRQLSLAPPLAWRTGLARLAAWISPERPSERIRAVAT